MAEQKPMGLYVHIPFCAKKCDYCDFTSYPMDKQAQIMYLKGLYEEIDQLKDNFCDKIFDTIYIGGGTPSFVYDGFISELSFKIFSSFQFADKVEFTIEVNPSSFTREKFYEYLKAGVNRISVGVQCLNSHLLANHGRLQSLKSVKNTFKMLKNADFANVSGDVMLGLPGQTKHMVTKTVKFLIKNGCSHISTYALQIEKGTIMYDKFKRGQLRLVPDAKQLAIYNKVYDILKKNGFKRYEVSNFARPGFESHHNGKYWDGTNYLGLGVSAHSFIGDYRYYNTKRVDTYLDAMRQGKSAVFKREYLDTQTRRTECIMLALRTAKGLNLEEFRKTFNEDIMQTHADIIKKYINNDMLELNDGYLRVTEQYFYVSNSIILELI